MGVYRMDIEQVKQSNLQQAIEKVEREEQQKKEEALREEERTARVIFEEDEEITLRDGKKYKIPPCNFKDARKLMQLLKTVNVDAIIMNFLPTGEETVDEERIKGLREIMRLALRDYPELTDDYIDEYIDIRTAREIIYILIDLNGLKK